MAVTSQLHWDGERVEATVDHGIAAGLRLGAEHLLQVSRTLVPLDEATLERSGVADVDEGALRAAVSYDTVYAVRQHEELTWRHDPGRRAKYLEQPAHTEAPTIAALIAARLREVLS